MQNKPKSKQMSLTNMISGGLLSFGDLLTSDNRFANLEAARPPRCRLTSSWMSANDFTLEIVGEQMPAPAGVDEATAKLMRGWLRSRQVIAGILTGENALEGITLQDALGHLEDERIIKLRDKRRIGSSDFVQAIPLCLFKDAMEFLMQAAPGLPAPWDIPFILMEEDVKVGLTEEGLFKIIDRIQATEPIISNLPKVPGPFIPLGAATPRPTEDHSDVQRNTRWVTLQRWGGTLAFKIRIEVRDGRMTAMSAVPELEGGTREEPAIVQQARNPDRHGRPQLTPMPSLPPLAENCRFLTDTFARREDIISTVPEFAKWAAGAGLALFLLQQINLSASGKVMLREIMDSQVEYKEEATRAKLEAAETLRQLANGEEVEAGQDDSILMAAIANAPLALTIGEDEGVTVEAPTAEDLEPAPQPAPAPETEQEAPVTEEAVA